MNNTDKARQAAAINLNNLIADRFAQGPTVLSSAQALQTLDLIAAYTLKFLLDNIPTNRLPYLKDALHHAVTQLQPRDLHHKPCPPNKPSTPQPAPPKESRTSTPESPKTPRQDPYSAGS